MDPSDYLHSVLNSYIVTAPIVVAQLVGFILAIVYARRYPRPATCMLVAMSILLVMPFISPLVMMIAPIEDPFGARMRWFVLNVVRGAVLVLIVLAVFGWRSSTREVVSRPGPAVAPVAAYEVASRPGSALVISWSIISALSQVVSIVALYLAFEAGPRISRSEEKAIVTCLIAAVLLTIPGVVLYFVWLYQAWRAVPPQYRSTTPGKAVGLLFIPIFNIYWVFRAVPGLSKSIERALEATNPSKARGPGYGSAVFTCIISIIPYVNLASGISYIIWGNIANAAKNRMLRSMIEQERTLAQPRESQAARAADDSGTGVDITAVESPSDVTTSELLERINVLERRLTEIKEQRGD